MKNKTESYQNRIIEIEKELADEFQIQQNLEKELASKYAEGSDTSTVLKTLTESRDKTGAMISALGQLDKNLYDIQSLEHNTISKKLDIEARQQYENSVKDAASSLKPFVKTLTKYISKAEAGNVVHNVLEIIKASTWKAADQESTEKYLATCPAAPAQPPKRDDHGLRIDESQIIQPVRAFGR